MALTYHASGGDSYNTAYADRRWFLAGNVGTPMARGQNSVSGAIVQHSLTTGTASFGTGARLNTAPQFVNILYIRTGTATHATLQISANGELVLIFGSTTLKSGVIVHSGQHHYEVAGLIDNSSGWFKVWFDGVLTNIDISGAPTDTQNGASALIDNYQWAPSGTGQLVSDLYFRDDNTGQIGDCRVDTVWPTGAGNYSDFSDDGSAPGTGDSVYTNVDDAAAPDDSTTYNHSATPADQDSFTHGGITLGSSVTIHAVQVVLAALKDDAGARTMSAFIRSGGVDGTPGTALALTELVTNYAYAYYLLDPRAGTPAWTETNFDGAEIGYEVTA